MYLGSLDIRHIRRRQPIWPLKGKMDVGRNRSLMKHETKWQTCNGNKMDTLRWQAHVVREDGRMRRSDANKIHRKKGSRGGK